MIFYFKDTICYCFSIATNLTDDNTIPNSADNNVNNTQTSEIAVEDLEQNDLGDLSQKQTKVCDEDDSDKDDLDLVKAIMLADPHQKHISKDGEACFATGCLDCLIEEAAKDIKEDPDWTCIPTEWFADYLDRFMFQEGRGQTLGETAQMSLDRELATRYEEKRRRKEEKAARKEERKKRRKVIERLIRLEGELNGSMGTYATAFDTKSEPVSYRI